MVHDDNDNNLQGKNVSIQESLNKKSADIELYDGNNGGHICDDGACGGDVDNYCMGGDDAGEQVIVVALVVMIMMVNI
jgi:hypothetical protein